MILKKPPKKIVEIIVKLVQEGYEAFLVGGCVRDALINRKPKDWDVTTNAEPEAIQKIFPNSFYENNFGTVGVKDEQEKTVYEVTTYRIERDYKDYRHPSKVSFTQNLTEDLARRDFTVNAMALSLLPKEKLIDPFLGKIDLENKLIKAVDNPQKRFKEDALRLIRAIRFSSELNFKIEKETFLAIQELSYLINKISKERIGEEFKKIILSPHPEIGIELLRETNLLKFILPELNNTVGVEQNLHHKRTVYDHILHTLKNCPSKKLTVRLAALFHDIAKPITKRGKGLNSTFYNHEYAGAKVAQKILKRLRFSEKIQKKTALLIRNHMFFYEVDTVTKASVRRLLRKVGRENIKDLIELRIADRLGSDCPKAKPYKLRHFEYLVDKVQKDPISVKMLKVDGNDLNKQAGIDKGPKMGAILEVLLAKVIENPKLNTKNFLLVEAKKLNNKNLESLQQEAKEKINQKKNQEDKKLKSKHWVK